MSPEDGPRQQEAALPGLVPFLRWVNALRRGERESPDAEAEVLEAAADTLFGCTEKLAVYGSLRPGRENHGVVASLEGRWNEGFVRGRLREDGWGVAMGYPALRWDPGAEPVAASLFESEELPGHWDRLDRFEGPAYVRILVPVEDESGLLAVANLYAFAD